MNKKGFTLIELVMIIVILGILAAVAIPKYYDLTADAQAAAEKGVVGGVRSAIHTYYAENRTWPSTLDDAASGSSASKTNPFFDNVLSQGGVTDDWTKNRSRQYVGPNSGIYEYDNSDGSFLEQ
ncbi:MAG: prepilin-type N-terminal cleavage/methylation domain-containing protein [Candidatus Omnitrophica bacterium]|nr:prepilin-type N-terminal cleavage/methylation domain-containing protein [Candidatus Omnitrophota bacterium]